MVRFASALRFGVLIFFFSSQDVKNGIEVVAIRECRGQLAWLVTVSTAEGD